MRLLILSVLLWLCMVSYAQEEKTLTDRFESAVSDSQKVISAYDLVTFYFSRQPEKAKPYALKAEEYALKSGNAFLEAKGHEAMLIYFRRMQDFVNMSKRYPLWREAALRSGNKIVIYDAFLSSANFSIDMEMFQAALPYLNKAAEMAEQSGIPLLKARILHTEAGYYSGLGEHGKAVEIYDEAIAALNQAKDYEKLADAKAFKAESLLRLWKTKEVPQLISDALNYYATTGKRSRIAYCKGLLGQAHAYSGNMKQAVSNYQEAVALYEAIPMKQHAAQCYVDLAGFMLAQQKPEEADRYLSSLEKLLPALYNPPPLKVYAAMLRAVYYTTLNKVDKADSIFHYVAKETTRLKLAPLKAENDLNHAALMLKQGKKRAGDSLFLLYAEGIAATQDKAEIEGALTLLKLKNPHFPERYWTLLGKLYTKGGAQQIKMDLLANGADTLPPLIDSIAAQNRYSLNTVERDSLNGIQFNRQLQELETRYKIRQMNDSLVQVKLEVQNEQLKSSRRTWQLIFAISGLLLLGVLLWNRVANARKLKTKKDELDQQNNELTLRNETITILRKELGHRIQNTLQAITSYVGMLTVKYDAPYLRQLNVMVHAMGTLHDSLYGEMEGEKIPVRPFLEALYKRVEPIFSLEIPLETTIRSEIKLDKDRMRTIAIIVSELWTNSFKHAFTGRDAGKMEVSLVQHDEQKYKLIVADNGVGFVEKKTDRLGHTLIRGMVKSGLGGTCSIKGEGGTYFEAFFPISHPKSTKRMAV